MGRLVESLELRRELDFDLLVPWVVDAENPYLAPVGAGERQGRIDTLLEWVRMGI